MVRQFSVDDFAVFLMDVRSRTALDDRRVALTAAFELWRQGGRGRKGRERMWRAVKGDSDLEARLHALLRPGPISKEERLYRRLEQDVKRRQTKHQTQEEQARREWSVRLRSNVDRLRSVDQTTVDQVFGELYSLGEEITRLVNSQSRWGSSRWDLLESEFGREVAEAARDGLMAV